MTAVETQTLLPIQCEPWCEEGDGHPDEWHPDDQWCASRGRIVEVSRYPLVRMDDDSMRREWVKVLACRGGLERPHIDVVAFDKPGVQLTKADALELAAELVAEAELR